MLKTEFDNIFLRFQERVFFLTGIALGMAIHFKIYPIIFTLPLYSALMGPTSQNGHSGDTITNYIRSLFDFNRARTRLVLGTYQENVRNMFIDFYKNQDFN